MQDIEVDVPTSTLSRAERHLWPHFTPLSFYKSGSIPVVVRGEGAWIFDERGRRYLDGVSGLYVVQAGYGRRELAEAAHQQASELGYFPLWGQVHPAAIELAERIAAQAPGDLDRVFFTTGGSEAIESAWKFAKQYFKLIGKPSKYKVISRVNAFHGTTLGALALNSVPAHRIPFEPLPPGARKAANTNLYRATVFAKNEAEFGNWAADQIEAAIVAEGPDSVAAVFLEPLQNSGGCLPPPAGYFDRVRDICDRHDVLLVSDEVICGWGRLGESFGAQRYGYQPDIIACAKGLTSGYSPLGATVISERLVAPFLEGYNLFSHGYTFGGHPVSCAVALANLDIFEREGLYTRVREHEGYFRQALNQLTDLPIVGEIRGDGYFYGIVLVQDSATRTRLAGDILWRVLEPMMGELFDAGLFCRIDALEDLVIQLAPPLICGPTEFDEMVQIIREVLVKAMARI